MKKFIWLLGVLLLFSVMTPTYAVDNEDFAINEEKYRNICTGTIESEQRALCTSFQEYLNQKIEGAKNSITELSESIAAVENNLAEADKLLRQQQAEIEAAQQEIEYLNTTITVIEESIEVLKVEIEESTQEIATVDDLIKKRLVAQQSELHVNSMINFLFGGKSYTDMARRAHTVDQMTKQDKDQMDWFINEKAKLEDDEVELNRQQDVLEVSLQNQNDLKAALEVAKAENEVVIAQYQEEVANLNEQQAILQAQQSASESEIDLIRAQFTDLDNREEQLRLEAQRLAAEAEEARKQAELAAQQQREAEAAEAARRAEELQQQSDQVNQEADEVAQNPTPIQPIVTGSGWSLPVYGAMVSAGAWYYGGGFGGIFGGGVHYGLDLAAPMGTPVYSTGPGVTVFANNSCPAWGWLGNPCGSYGGNQVITIVSINNSLYALTYAHLQSAAVSQGTPIEAGTLLGYLGSSGNSSGPHLHHEVYYLGDMSLGDYLSTWNGSMSFTPSGEWMNLSWACETKGSAPCRHNPQTWYGVQVGVTY